MVTTMPFDPGSSSTADRCPRRGYRDTVLIVAEELLAVGAFAGAAGLIVAGVDLAHEHGRERPWSG